MKKGMEKEDLEIVLKEDGSSLKVGKEIRKKTKTKERIVWLAVENVKEGISQLCDALWDELHKETENGTIFGLNIRGEMKVESRKTSKGITNRGIIRIVLLRLDCAHDPSFEGEKRRRRGLRDIRSEIRRRMNGSNKDLIFETSQESIGMIRKLCGRFRDPSTCRGSSLTCCILFGECQESPCPV